MKSVKRAMHQVTDIRYTIDMLESPAIEMDPDVGGGKPEHPNVAGVKSETKAANAVMQGIQQKECGLGATVSNSMG